jgi:NADPH:quinone reductase-like Zn-dependent oxidoreductase
VLVQVHYSSLNYKDALSVDRLLNHGLSPEQGRGGGYGGWPDSGNSHQKHQVRRAVTCCGNVASPNLELTVYSFILRGVALLGIDAARCNMELRRRVWTKLAGPWKLEQLTGLAETISLPELDQAIDAMLEGRMRGRLVLRHEIAAARIMVRK